jgi:hypothetical protein
MREDWEEALQEAVDRKLTPVYMTSKTDVIEAYKDKYGQKRWTRAIAEDLYGTIKNRKGENVSIDNIMRRFQGGREAKGEGRSSQVYKQLGEKFEPVRKELKGDSITITVKGEQERDRKRRNRDREWTVTFTGSDAKRFAQEPTMADIWDHEGYPDDVVEGFEGDQSGGLFSVSIS